MFDWRMQWNGGIESQLYKWHFSHCEQKLINKLIKMSQNLLFSFGLAGIVRCFLITSNFAETIRNRVEVTTPLNSWKRSKILTNLKTISFIIFHQFNAFVFFDLIFSSGRCISVWKQHKSIFGWFISWKSTYSLCIELSYSQC